MTELGVNIDHVATIRQARGTQYPDPVEAAIWAEKAGATGITVHLREDRRHIQESDVWRLREVVQTKLNLEMACSPEIVQIACRVKPDEVCLVPEKRQELTTEGGLDVLGNYSTVQDTIQQLHDSGVKVSLFIESHPDQIQAAAEIGADFIEIHTGRYAELSGEPQIEELEKIRKGLEMGIQLHLGVNAGHGLHYQNVKPIAALPQMGDLNIGHSIVSRALFTGFYQAVQEMLSLIREASPIS